MTGPVRAKRTLFAAAVFDSQAPSAITYLHCAREVTSAGILEALTLEAHKAAGLQTEHLKTGDWIDCEYDSFWPHTIPDGEHAIGVYVPRFVIRRIWGMSTPFGVLRTPPPQPAFFGPFEIWAYQAHLAMIRGH